MGGLKFFYPKGGGMSEYRSNGRTLEVSRIHSTKEVMETMMEGRERIFRAGRFLFEVVKVKRRKKRRNS
jgi:hypothetical protein